MSDRKALTSDIGGGARFQIGDDDDHIIPAMKSSSGSKSAFFSQWMNRLGGATKRRGSVGFNENNLADLPPSRFDDDSRSNSFIDGQDSRDGFGSKLMPRKRNESFNEYGMTPGDDSDGFLLKNKFRFEHSISVYIFQFPNIFRRNDSDSRLEDRHFGEISRSKEKDSVDSITPNVCGLGLQTVEVAANVCGLGLATVEEGKVMNSAARRAEETPEEKAGDPGQIFLIDIEESRDQDSGKTVLKPSSRKFAASVLLQNKFAQNWFFRNSDNEDTDNLVDEENEGQGATNRVLSRDERQSDNNEDNKTGKTILGKIKKIVDTNKTKHREMNFWQPQGS